MLRHTTEEVLAACIEAMEPTRAALTSRLRELVMTDLKEGLKNHRWFAGFDIKDELPVRYPLEQWIKQAKEADATVFIAGFVSHYWVPTPSNLISFKIDLFVTIMMRKQTAFSIIFELTTWPFIALLGMCSSSHVYASNYNVNLAR